MSEIGLATARRRDSSGSSGGAARSSTDRLLDRLKHGLVGELVARGVRALRPAAAGRAREPVALAPVPRGSAQPRTDLEPRQRAAERAHRRAGPRFARLGNDVVSVLQGAGLNEGRVLEIGGRANPLRSHLAGYDYAQLDLIDTGPDVIVADITGCPEVPDGSFDAIVSIDVFEHIDRPWLAAAEIKRLLRPGGATYHSTLFSWRYHPCPIDYWRFTPPALEFLFDGLETIKAEFDPTERRRDLRGQGRYELKPDAFGGWRENWRVTYAGSKPAEVASRR